MPLAWLLGSGPGLVAPLAGLPTFFPQVGFEDPLAPTLLFAGLAVYPLLAWSGGVCSVHTHPLLVVAVLAGTPGQYSFLSPLVAPGLSLKQASSNQCQARAAMAHLLRWAD